MNTPLLGDQPRQHHCAHSHLNFLCLIAAIIAGTGIAMLLLATSDGSHDNDDGFKRHIRENGEYPVPSLFDFFKSVTNATISKQNNNTRFLFISN
jgi:hypothetical protein